jgi:hypothetical protein
MIASLKNTIALKGDCMTIECEHGQLARACNICEYEREIAELKGKLSRLTALIESDDVAEQVGTNCRDQYHDNRWCPTCESRKNGIDDYRTMLKGEMK